MARPARMEKPPTDDEEIIKGAAKEYLNLEAELTEKRSAQSETTDGKTVWRRHCVEQRVDPVELAWAANEIMLMEADPEKRTEAWRRRLVYLKALNFPDMLHRDLFDGVLTS